MTDFETRVREALTNGADGAPTAVGLADGARTRMRRRRRNTSGVVAAAFLVAAVPVGFAVVSGLGDDEGDGKSAVELAEVPDGLKAYSYLDATVLVPANWRNDGRYLEGDWCNGAKRPSEGTLGYVGILDVRTEMACLDDEPLSNYEPFASFSTQRQGPARVEADGWVTENLQVGSAWLTIRYDDPALGEQIKDSAEVIVGHDANGCATGAPAMTDDAWRPPVVFDLADAEVDQVSACGHANVLSGNTGPTLTQSSAWTGADAQDLVDLLLAQPGAAPTEEACFVSAASVWILNVQSSGEVQQVLVRRDYCHGLGTDDGTTYRQDSYELNAWLELGSRVPSVPDAPDEPVSSDESPISDPEAPVAPDSDGGGSAGYAGE